MAETRDRTVEIDVEVKLDPEAVQRLMATLDQIHGSLMRAAQAMATMLQEIADAVGPLAVEDQSVIIATRSAAHLEGSTADATGESGGGEQQRSIYDELDGR